LFPYTILPPPRLTLFPYTTLFRSKVGTVYGEFRSYGSVREARSNAHLYRDPHFFFVLRPNSLAIRSRPQWWIAAARKVDSAILRSEEHTSELQSPCNLVCRLLLEK